MAIKFSDSLFRVCFSDQYTREMRKHFGKQHLHQLAGIRKELAEHGLKMGQAFKTEKQAEDQLHRIVALYENGPISHFQPAIHQLFGGDGLRYMFEVQEHIDLAIS
jgi:hypothetical protein